MKLLPRRRDGLETRARLLRIARETFEERGYHRTSVAEICRRASVANGTFYRYFNSKDEVFLLLADVLGQELEDVVTKSLQRADTVRDKLFQFQLAFYEYAANNRALYQIFREAEFIQLSLPVRTYHRLAEGLERHLFGDSGVNDVARFAVPYAILGGAYMLATKYVIWDEGEPSPALIKSMSDFLAHGLSPDRSAPVGGRTVSDLLRAVFPAGGSAVSDGADEGFAHDARGLTDGERTRRRLLNAAQLSFGRLGFFGTQIADITRLAGVAQGTFYVHFPGKVEILHDLVRDISRRLRDGLRSGIGKAAAELDVEHPDRRLVEAAGLAAFLQWLDGRDGIYRIVREAEFVDEDVAKWYYGSLVKGYVRGLEQGMTAKEIRPFAAEPLAYCLLGIGHISGLRWVLWPKEREGRVPANIIDVASELAVFLLYGVDGVKAGTVPRF